MNQLYAALPTLNNIGYQNIEEFIADFRWEPQMSPKHQKIPKTRFKNCQALYTFYTKFLRKPHAKWARPIVNEVIGPL